MRRKNQRGAAILEMTLIGIPIIFVLISIFEISRGMWIYETAAHAVREGVRFAVVHGINCVNDPSGGITNNCGKTVADVAAIVRTNGPGLDPDTTTLTFIAPSPGGATVTCTITACAANTTTWPPVGNNQVQTQIQINIITPFNSALAMFWPGAAPTSFASSNFGATSIDTIQF